VRALSPILLMLIASCGDSGAGGAATSPDAQSAPGRVLVDRTYVGVGVVGRTWIDGHVVGQGAPGTLEAQLERSYEDFGARIAGSDLEIRLPGAPGEGFTITRHTDNLPIPGAVALDLDPAAARVDAGGLRDRDRGSVTISDCPRGVGDTVRGSVEGVLLAGDSLEGDWRMDLDFEVVVTAASGELACGTGGGGGASPDPGDDPVCANTLCEDPSFGCCPFDECLDECEGITCARVPCEGDDQASCKHRCLLSCVESCSLGGACVTAAQGLWDCQLDSGCFASGVSEDACTRENCCDAFTAAY